MNELVLDDKGHKIGRENLSSFYFPCTLLCREETRPKRTTKSGLSSSGVSAEIELDAF